MDEISEAVLSIIGCILAISFVPNIVCGAITNKMSYEKGYKGGFVWGFFMGLLGIAVVACRPYQIDYFCSRIKGENNIQAEPDKANLSYIQCDKCNAILPSGSQYCTKCGNHLKTP